MVFFHLQGVLGALCIGYKCDGILLFSGCFILLVNNKNISVITPYILMLILLKCLFHIATRPADFNTCNVFAIHVF